MHINLNTLRKDILQELRKICKQSKEGENILSVYEFKLKQKRFYLFIISIIPLLLISTVIGWDTIYLLYGLIIISSFFFARFMYLLYFSCKIKKSFVYFDENIVIKKNLDTIEIYRLNELKAVNCSKTDDSRIIMIRLSFDNETIFGNKKIYFPYKRTSIDKINTFTKNIIDLSNTKREGIHSNKFHSSTKINSILYAKQNRKKSKFKLIFLTISVLVMSLILSNAAQYVIDYNSYQEAEEIYTATSFRNYLKEKRNHLYISSAKEEIKTKYDDAIYKYSKINADDKKAIIKILTYLKVHEIYYVDIFFKNKNRIRDINENNDLKIISAKNSLTVEKERSRRDELISTLNKTLGSIFPSDIISIEKMKNRENIPRIEIMYTYSNSEDNSLYYPVVQESMNDHQRDYYYGLTIYWHFKLFIPTEKLPIYHFLLKTNPAIQFSADSSNTDNVYSNMVFSAFRNFDTEFKKHFLGNEKN